jgi:hypothetical protein
MVQVSLISLVLFSLYVNDKPKPLHHVALALYVVNAAIIATSHKPTLLISYLESYLNDFLQWLSEWRIAINISKSTSVIFTSAGQHFIKPQPVKLFREPIQWFKTRNMGVTLDTRLSWSPHINKVRKKATQKMGMLGPLLNRSDISIRKGVLLYKQLILPMMDYTCPTWRFT